MNNPLKRKPEETNQSPNNKCRKKEKKKKKKSLKEFNPRGGDKESNSPL